MLVVKINIRVIYNHNLKFVKVGCGGQARPARRRPKLPAKELKLKNLSPPLDLYAILC